MSSHSQVLLLLSLAFICSQGRVVTRQPVNMDILEEFNTMFGYNWWVNVTEDSEHNKEPLHKNNYQKDDSEVLTEDKFDSDADDLTQPNTDGFDQWWLKQKQLKKQIKETCKLLGPSLRKNIKQKEQKKSFLYDPEHQILWCRNAKVGTTTWLTHFLQLSTLSESEKKNITNVHRRIPGLFPVPESVLDLRKLANVTTSFSMVRHPFERLVSAYLSKMQKGSDRHFLSVRNFIKEKYGEVTFPNFIHLILHESKAKCRSMNTCKLDKHWLPYISRCAFCDIPYRVIGKAETFQEDTFYISQLAGVQLGHVIGNRSGGSLSSRDLTRHYFGQLDRRTVERLYRLYQVDFQMFGYSPDLYIPSVQVK